MFCKYCGASLSEGSAFCTNCGKDLRPQSRPDAFQTPAAQQGAPAQPGTYQIPPGYPMPPAAYPPRRANTGRIVLWSAAGAVVLVAVIVACVLIFSAPKDAHVDASATPGATHTLKPSAAPTETAAPTATAVPTPALTGTLTGFPYSFVQLSYPDADFMPKYFSGVEEFETELTATAWNYYEARNNIDAVSFNGGYVDIGYADSMQIIHEYVFGGDYSIKNYQLSAQDFSVVNEYSNSYWTQGYEDSYAACYDMGIETELNGGNYKTVVILFIDQIGDLVESMALFDPYNNTFLLISNYDIYEKSAANEPPANTDSGDVMSQEQFESTLQSCIWVYSSTQEAPREMVVDEFSDITPETPCDLAFTPEMELEYIDTAGEEGVDEPAEYVFGKNHAYVPIEQYENEGVTYEIDMYYSISADGTLLEQMMAYDAASGTYLTLSNINVYTAETT